MKKVIIVVVAVALAAVLGTLAAMMKPKPQAVRIYAANGNGFTMSVLVGDAKAFDVEPWAGSGGLLCEEGAKIVVKRADGSVVEETSIPRDASDKTAAEVTPVVVYNIGAQAVIGWKQVSLADEGAKAESEKYTYSTDRFLRYEQVDYPFMPFDKKVEVEAGKVKTVTQLQVFPGRDLDAVNFLEEDRRQNEARELAAARLKYGSASPDLVDYMVTWNMANPEAGLEQVNGLLASGDGDVAVLHRLRQEALLQTCDQPVVAEEYKKLMEANKNSIVYEYLYARLLPANESVKIVEQLLNRAKECPWIAILAGQTLTIAEKFDEAADAYKTAGELFPEYMNLQPQVENALILAGRAKEVVETASYSGMFPNLYLTALLDLGKFDEATAYVNDWSEELDERTVQLFNLYIAWAKGDMAAVERIADGWDDPDEAAAMKVFVTLAAGKTADANKWLGTIQSPAVKTTTSFAVALSYEAAGEKDAARQLYEQIAKQFEGMKTGPVVKTVAEALIGKATHQEAVRRMLENGQPTNLAWLYLLLGYQAQQEEAQTYFMKAAAVNHYPGPFRKLVQDTISREIAKAKSGAVE